MRSEAVIHVVEERGGGGVQAEGGAVQRERAGVWTLRSDDGVSGDAGAGGQHHHVPRRRPRRPPHFPKSCPTVAAGAEIRPNVGPHWPRCLNLGRCVPKRLGPDLADLGRTRSTSGKDHPTLGQTRPRIGSALSNIWPTLAHIGANFCPHRPSLADFGPNFGFRGNFLSIVRQLFCNFRANAAVVGVARGNLGERVASTFSANFAA